MKSVNENNPLISVIVPVYNVEPYLDRCVDSIVSQTFRNLEIILVDDSSPDNCPQMCDAWAEKDSRIKVIHKLNGGLSDARNVGMAAATGELMGFVDSDDWIREDMYQLLYRNMLEHNSDISACGVKMVWEDGSPDRLLTKKGSMILDAEDAMLAVINGDWIQAPVWYKLYKTDLIRSILFSVGKHHEDVFWTYQAVGTARRVSLIDEPCYYYWQRSGSIMGECFSLKRLDALEEKCNRQDYIAKQHPTMFDKANADLWFNCLYTMQMAMLHCSPDDRCLAWKQIQKILKTYPLTKKSIANLGFKQKIWGCLSLISFTGACRLRNVFRIGL